MKYSLSPLNHIFNTLEGETILFSGLTNSFFSITNNLQEKLNEFKKETNIFTKNELKILSEKGILIERPWKQIEADLKKRSIQNMSKQCLFITVLPTFSCNFNCPYCYEKKHIKNERMDKTIIDKILNLIESHKKEYTIDWYGGEPTLSLDLLQYFYSEAEKRQLINRHSLLISNGSIMNIELLDILQEHISELQITIDGPKQIHDFRRIYKDGRGSFDKIISNLDKIFLEIKKGKLPNLEVIIRCNIDKNNADYFMEFREFIINRYENYYRIDCFYVNDCGADDYESNTFSRKDYSNYIYNLFVNHGVMVEPYLPGDGKLKYKFCGAESINSYVFDPAGNIFKCCLDSGMEDRIIGNVNNPENIYKNGVETAYILSTTEFFDKDCSNCPLLLMCWGGCPHSRLYNDMKKYCFFSIFNLDKMLELRYLHEKYNKQYKKYLINYFQKM